MSWPAAANRSKRSSYDAPRGASESDQRLILTILADATPEVSPPGWDGGWWRALRQDGDRLRPVDQPAGQVAEQLGQPRHEVVVGAGRTPEHRDAPPRHRLGEADQLHVVGRRHRRPHRE